MSLFKHTKSLLALIILGFFFYSCEKREVSEILPTNTENFEVSAKLAERVAFNFSNGVSFCKKLSGNKFKSASLKDSFEKKRVKEVVVIPDNDGNPSMYVVNFIPKGYVIVSATKKESPILGYSESSVFDFNSIPAGMAMWLIDRVEKIQILKQSESIKISKEVMREWRWGADGIPDVDDEEVINVGTELEQKGPLLTTLWGQGYGYNVLLEKIDGVFPLTGCVATAMAQIMNYYEFPTTYNWDGMPDLYATHETAVLMKDIGVAVNMEYGLGGSSASTLDALDALVSKFGYSNSAHMVDYDVSSVVDEIKGGRPVIMDAYRTYYTTTSGWWIWQKTTHHYRNGHVWVCDGYKRTLYKEIHNPGTLYEYEAVAKGKYFLHMNWGWGGVGMDSDDNNGWFRYDNFVLSNGYNYQYRKKCIVGIKP